MQRSLFLRWTLWWLPGLIIVALAAGCAHHAIPTAPAPAPPAVPVAATPPPAPPAAFQPYTLLPSPPPAPPVAVPRHRVLHLTRVHQQIYLEDSDRHLYEAGRDTQGHIYPIYRDPATRVTYPLYYDSSRDNLYRLARSDNGHFYRNYVGQSTDNFYDSDRDYERITPSDQDRPIVTDSYNTYNYNTYNNYGPRAHRRDVDYGGYRPYNEDPDYGQNHPYYTGYAPPPTHHSSHFNYNWLWAIPVIVGAYLLLQPHHSHPPTYQPAPTVIIRQNRPTHISDNNINNTTITNTNIRNINVRNTTINNTVINQAVPVGYRPIASPRPVYVTPAGYRPQTFSRVPGVRPHGPIRVNRPIIAAPLGALAAHTALVRPSSQVKPPIVAHPASIVVHRVTPSPRPFASAPRRIVPVAASVKPMRHIILTERRHPRGLALRPVYSLSRPTVHTIAPPVHLTSASRPRVEPRPVSRPPSPRPQQVRLRAVPRKAFVRPRLVEPEPVIKPKRVNRRPPPAVRLSVTAPRQTVVRLRAVPRPQPHLVPHTERPASPRPARVRPRPVPAPSKSTTARKRPETPRNEDRPKKEAPQNHSEGLKPPR